MMDLETLPTFTESALSSGVQDSIGTRTDGPSETSIPTSSIDWMRLVVAVADSTDQRNAASRIVSMLTEMLPGHTIRLGWGKRLPEYPQQFQLRHLIDSRLGWLGIENSIRQRLSNDLQESETLESVHWGAYGLILRLLPGDDETTWEGRVWILPPLNDTSVARSLLTTIQSRELTMLASVLASRPEARWWTAVGMRLAALWDYRSLIAMAVLAFGILAMMPRQYPVQSVVSITAQDARVLAAPFEGVLSATHVRPGDRVKAGQPLVELDGRAMRIEAESIAAELQQAIKDEDIALASGQISQSQLAGLKRQSLAKRMELIESRLEQLVIVSPIDGMVIQGDLQRMLGTTATTGQMLLEVAPEGKIEIEVEIPEIEVGMVGRDSVVKMWFPAAGGQTYLTQLSSLWPASVIRNDQNVFIGHADLPIVEDEANASRLRVGMVGEATIYGPKRPLAWRWLRTPVRRVAWMLGW